jgi:hypothetical protein
MRILLFLLVLVSPLFVFPQNNFSIVKLLVSEKQTNLPLSGTDVIVKEINKHFTSDVSGIVKMALIPGKYTFEINQDDFLTKIVDATICGDTSMAIRLQSIDKILIIEEINVFEKKQLKNSWVETGVEFMTSKSINAIPVMGGEKDLVKSLALLPGMQTSSEGTSNLVVRGGNPDQNLFLLNGLPLFQTNHFFSMVSAVNPMLINQVQVYKSGFPANYGGRISSVVDMTTKTPDMDTIHGEGDIGLLSTKLMISAPVVKNKLSVMLGGRRTYLDLVARPFKDQLGNITFNYTDLSFLANWKVSEKNIIMVFTSYSQDNYMDIYEDKTTKKEESNNRKSWDNVLSGLQWDYNSRDFSNQMKVGYSGYKMKISNSYDIDSLNKTETIFHSQLQYIVLSDRMNFEFSSTIIIDAGFQLEDYRLIPATINYTGSDSSYSQERIENYSFQSSTVWGSVNFTLSKLKANAGIRGTMNFYNGSSFFIPEPRVNIQYLLSENSSIKASYTRISQPLHLLSNTGLGLPVDLWIGSNQNRKPLISNQWALGYNSSLLIDNLKYEFSVEGYYKTTENLVSYRDGYSSTVFTSENYLKEPGYLEKILSYGRGKSYGLELMIEKKEGNFTGWISYTLSKSRNSFSDFETGKWFNSPYDRPHNFSVVGSYKLKKGWDLNFSFSLLSGQPFTFPEAVYSMNAFDMLTSKAHNDLVAPIYINSVRNGIRLKTFHKLDIGVMKQLKSRKHFSHWLELSVYNVYNRKNSTYGFLQDNSHLNRLDVVSVSLFPIIPSISYGFRF